MIRKIRHPHQCSNVEPADTAACLLGKSEVELMLIAVNEMGLSARVHDKYLRVARTIADLDESEPIQSYHVQEAINYQMLDRDIFSYSSTVAVDQ